MRTPVYDIFNLLEEPAFAITFTIRDINVHRPTCNHRIKKYTIEFNRQRTRHPTISDKPIRSKLRRVQSTKNLTQAHLHQVNQWTLTNHALTSTLIYLSTTKLPINHTIQRTNEGAIIVPHRKGTTTQPRYRATATEEDK